jgi:ABC-type glycerol-3-phosphate transport system substrate-binding protein
MKPMPAWDGGPNTLVNGWSWALTGEDPARQALGVRLAEFLLEDEFLASWSEAAGYLPPTEDALDEWRDASLRQAAGQVSDSAQLIPAADLVSSLGPALEQALVKVLKAESDPQSAAAAAYDQIHQP